MSKVAITSLSGTFFTSDTPDVKVAVPSGAVKARVRMTVDGSEIYDETLWPVDGDITLTDLGGLLEPLAMKGLVLSLVITAQPLDTSGSSVGSLLSGAATILLSRADVGVSASDFYTRHFLSILMGTKVTAAGRRELLWFYCGPGVGLTGEDLYVTAEYADGGTLVFEVSVLQDTGVYYCIDASPDLFTASGRQLIAYTVSANARKQRFEIDFREPECMPVLMFKNSFGVQEYIYCTGKHQVTPEYKRSTARIGFHLRNYRIEETRTFKADTGFLNAAMADWADDLFRSDKVYLLDIVDGALESAVDGREVLVTESKSEVTNEDDFMPRFTFSYQYAQRIQDVVRINRVGRVFDYTHDYEFD